MSFADRAILPALRAPEGTFERFWLDCGFPQVTLGHRLAASLMASSVAREEAVEVVEPWPAFVVRVPDGVLPGGYDDEDWVEDILVMSKAAFAMKATGIENVGCRRGVMIVRRGGQTTVRNVRGGGDNWGALAGVDTREVSSTLPLGMPRILDVACKLVLGVMIELDSPAQRERIGQGPPRKSKRWGALPKKWLFTLTRDVRVDVREEIRTYCLGGKGKSPTVQVLVRGHHRRQPCGVGRTERRWISVDPYWRGPEDAPIGVRSHVIADP